MAKCKESEMTETEVLEAEEEGVAETGKLHKEIKETGVKRNFSCSNGDVRCSTSVVQRRISERVTVEKENIQIKETSGCDKPCRSSSTDIDKEASEFSDLEEETSDISASTYSLKICIERNRRETETETIAESFDLKMTSSELPSGGNSGSLFSEPEETPLSITEEHEDSFLVADNDLLQHDVNSSRRSKKAKMPSNAELEDFFSVTENNLMQQFTHKYNFDFRKEEPMEGPFEWVQVSHNEHVL